MKTGRDLRLLLAVPMLGIFVAVALPLLGAIREWLR